MRALVELTEDRVIEPRDEVDDEELVARFRAGDRQAYSVLFRRHHARVGRVVHRLLGVHVAGASADVADVVQEVFLQAYRSLPTFRQQSRFTTWIYRIAVNVSLMVRRARRSRPQPSVEIDALVLEGAERDRPDQQLALRRQVRAFYSLLEQLSEKRRTVFVLHDLEGLEPREVAEAVSASVLSVRTRLFYARRDLRRLLARSPELAGLMTTSNQKDEA